MRERACIPDLSQTRAPSLTLVARQGARGRDETETERKGTRERGKEKRRFPRENRGERVSRKAHEGAKDSKVAINFVQR